jgi:hypothetical protein
MEAETQATVESTGGREREGGRDDQIKMSRAWKKKTRSSFRTVFLPVKDERRRKGKRGGKPMERTVERIEKKRETAARDQKTTGCVSGSFCST